MCCVRYFLMITTLNATLQKHKCHTVFSQINVEFRIGLNAMSSWTEGGIVCFPTNVWINLNQTFYCHDRLLTCSPKEDKYEEHRNDQYTFHLGAAPWNSNL